MNNITNSFDWIGFPGLRALGVDEEIIAQKVIRDKILYRGGGLTSAQYAAACEEKLSKLLNKKYCLLLNSATSALIAAFKSINLQFGDEVIIPAYGWLTVVMAVLFYDAIPVFCPVDSGLIMSEKNLGKCITKKTRAIIPIHACGNSADINKIKAIIGGNENISIIEDGCQCIFGYSTQASKLSDITFVSFQSFKLITCGEGGALLTDDLTLYQKAARFHDAGLLRFAAHSPKIMHEVPLGVGLNLRINELSAAILSCQIDKYQIILEQVKMARDKLLKTFNPLIEAKLLIPIQTMNSNNSFLLLEANTQEFAQDFVNILNQQGYPFKIAANLPYHALPGWINYLQHNNYSFKNIEPEQSLDILKRTIIIEVNYALQEKHYKKLNKDILNFLEENLIQPVRN